jgi:two-component system, sensor histidine kinase PdtaS
LAANGLGYLRKNVEIARKPDARAKQSCLPGTWAQTMGRALPLFSCKMDTNLAKTNLLIEKTTENSTVLADGGCDCPSINNAYLRRLLALKISTLADAHGWFTSLKTQIVLSPFCYIVLWLVCYATPSVSQNTQTESLSKTYQVKAEQFLYLPQFNLDSSYFYFTQAIQVLKANETAHYQALAEAYYELFSQLNTLNFSPEVDTCLQISHFYLDKITARNNQTRLLEYKILIQEVKKHYKKGERISANEKLVKAFGLVQDDKSPEVQAVYLFDKGSFGNRYKAFHTEISPTPFLASLKIYKKSNAPDKNQMMYKIYGELAWYHNLKKNVDSCDYYFDKQKAWLASYNSPYYMYFYNAMRANNYSRRKMYDQAIGLLSENNQMAEKYKFTRSEIFIFNNYIGAVADIEFKKYDTAIQKINQGLATALLMKGSSYIKDGYEHLANVYLLKGDYKKAFEYKELFSGAMNEIYGENLSKSLKENELQLDILKKDNQLAKSKQERTWYISLITLGGLLLGLLYRNYHLKQQTNKKLEVLNEDLAHKNALLDKRNAENELLLKEIHHRVKNNLEVVSSLLALQSAKIEDPEIQDAMLASQNRVQSMGILHQKLYQSEHLAFIEMKHYFQNLCENILDSYNETERIKVNIDMNELELDVDTAVPVGLIVNELLTNSLKYAFPDGKKGEIQLALENLAGNLYQLKIKDNGIGKTPNTNTKGTGFGTQLVDLLTRQIEGDLQEQNDNGTMIVINFKRQKAA